MAFVSLTCQYFPCYTRTHVISFYYVTVSLCLLDTQLNFLNQVHAGYSVRLGSRNPFHADIMHVFVCVCLCVCVHPQGHK